MPTYEYQCRVCDATVEVWKSIKDRNRAKPKHCGQVTKRIINAPMVAPLFDAYRAIGGDRRYIRSRQEHKDFLREFGYEEVGNDLSMYPTETDEERESRERDTFNSLHQLDAPAVASVLEKDECPSPTGPPARKRQPETSP